MDWHLNKVPASWDHLAELEHDDAVAAAATTAAAAGTSAGVHRHHHANADAASGCYRAPGGSELCSVDLKLGRGAADRRSRETAAAGKAPAPSSTSPAGPAAGAAANKRPRPTTGGGGAGQRCPPCAVDGCKADLSRCRDYHRRHKVCEAHSKTPVVVVAGREMRFCQQCSRFHLLGEFDEAKRSCRKRLDGHNRRRRKPQPDPMTSASFITGQQATRFSAFTTPRREANWPGMIKTEESPYYAHQIPLGSTTSTRHHIVGSTSSSAYAKEAAGRRSSFPFVQQEGEVSFASTGVVLEAPAATAAAPDHPESRSNKIMFSSDGVMTRVLDSDCALSLLSAPANSSGVDVVGGRVMVRSAEQLPPVAHHHPLQVPQFGGSTSWFSRPHQATTTGVVPSSTTTTGQLEGDQQQQQQELNTVLGANDGEMNYSGMFHVGGDGSSDDGTSSSLPFSWQ